MSITAIGSSASGVSSYKSQASSNLLEIAANASPLAPNQAFNLRRALRNDVEQAFQQGKTQSDVESRLEMNISKTLDNFGVSSADQESMTISLHKLFSQDRTPEELRTGVQQIVNRLLNNQTGSSSESSSLSTDGLGQMLNVLA